MAVVLTREYTMKRILMMSLVGAFFVFLAGAQNNKAEYLLEEPFWYLQPTLYSSIKIISGWDVNTNGGSYGYSYQSDFWITDNSNSDGVTLKHALVRQTAGTMVLEYRFNVDTKVDGITWQLRSGDMAAVKILTSNGNLCYENSGGTTVPLQAYDANTEVGVKVMADVTLQKMDIYVNGTLKAANADFRNNVAAIDNFYLYSGASGTCTLHQRFVYAYKGFIVNERFLAGVNGNIPDDWSVDSAGGSIRVMQNKEAAPPPDYYSVKINDASSANSVSMAKVFASQTGKVEFEYKFMQTAKTDGFAAELRNGSLPAVKMITDNGNLCYEDAGGSKVSVWNGYTSNVWYYVRVTADMDAHTADIYINDIKRATGAGFA
ncbi:MAG: hypothetical protein V1913_00695, partial [Fibrobacterota bacterium]